jgi:ketosteroid isomerase-like protein
MEELYAEDVVFDVSAVFTDVAPMQGKENVRRYWHELRETWAGLRLDPGELLDAGGGRYVLSLRLWGRGQRSGAEFDQPLAMLYDIRAEDLKATCVRVLPDVATALSVAESSASQPA